MCSHFKTTLLANNMRLKPKLLLFLCISMTLLLYSYVDVEHENSLVTRVLEDHDSYLLDNQEDGGITSRVLTDIILQQPTLPILGPPVIISTPSVCQNPGKCFPGFSQHVDFTQEIRNAVKGVSMVYRDIKISKTKIRYMYLCDVCTNEGMR